MKKLKYPLIVFLILIFLSGNVLAQNDYLSVTGQPKLTHTEFINSGDPYTAELSLKRVGILPRSATLNISTGAVNPIIEVTIDGVEQSFTSQLVSIPLPGDGVTDIDIKISGNAPAVKTDTTTDMVKVVTDVFYDDLNKGPQEELVRSLTVTNPEIDEANRAINEAKRKLLEAENALSDLRSQDMDTSSLDSRLEVARDTIKDAETSKVRGFPIEAKRQADNAIITLSEIITDAGSRSQRVIDIKKYATIAVVVIIALIGISVLRRKREELG